AAADQVEERGRELVRAGCRVLPDERRHERRLGVRGRRLLVLAVVAGRALAAVEKPDEQDQQERGRLAQDEQEERRSAEVALRVVDPLPVVLVGALRR